MDKTPKLRIEYRPRNVRKDRQIIAGLLQEGGNTANFITLTVRECVRGYLKHPEYVAPGIVELARRVDEALQRGGSR
jgi:hypothetical protein